MWWFCLFSCTQKLSLASLEVRCQPLLEEILTLQDKRSGLMDQMQVKSRQHKEGLITRKEHEDLYFAWRGQEVEFQNKVTKLYEDARSEGCL